MNDQPTSRKSLLEDELLDQLQSWGNTAQFSVDSLPTARQVAEMQRQLEEFRFQTPERAREFESKLKQLVETFKERYRDEIGIGLTLLEKTSASEGTWRTQLDGVERLLANLRDISGEDDPVARKQWLSNKARLQGESIELQAVLDIEQTIRDIEAREQAGQTVGLVEDARSLWNRVQGYHAEARSFNVPPIILERLADFEDRCETSYKIKRSSEGALTADIEGKYDEALHELEYVQTMEGPNGLVWYFSHIDASETELAQTSVSTAIRICKGRRTKNLSMSAWPHIEYIESRLGQGNPRSAHNELQVIVGTEHLDETTTNKLKGLGSRIDAELAELGRFEQAIVEAGSLQPPLRAWMELTQIGARSERFQNSCELWQQTRIDLRGRVRNDRIDDLVAAVRLIRDNDLARAKASFDQVALELKPWNVDFSDLLSHVDLISQLISGLEILLPQAEQEIGARQLEKAVATLRSLDNQFEYARQQLPEPVTTRMEMPRDYTRLQRVLASYLKADTLLVEMQMAVENTEKTAELDQLATEIKAHSTRVAPEYQADFEALGTYTEARYCYFRGKAILEVAGDTDEARRLLDVAAQHPQYADRAAIEIFDITKRVDPANGRVRDALSRIQQLSQQGQFWDAYCLANSLTSEPAQKRLRQELSAKEGEFRETAYRETLTILTKAITSETGNPDILRDHAKRLAVLDNAAYLRLEDDLWPVIHELEATLAAKSGQWEAAYYAYTEAANRVDRSGNSPTRSSELRATAEAAQKEYLLQLGTMLSPAILVEELQKHVSGLYVRDPDLRAALARALADKATRDESSYEEMPEDLRSDETETLRAIRRMILEAWQEANKADTLSQEWLLGERRPSYERARAAILRVAVDDLARQRITLVNLQRSEIDRANRLNQKKMEISRLFASFTLD